MILSAVSFDAGLILDTVGVGRREMKGLHHLALQGPTFRERRRSPDGTAAIRIPPTGASTARTVRTFALVGGVGFAVEAILFTTLVHLFGWQPWHARIPSSLTRARDLGAEPTSHA
jgi:hypothetical protein